MGASTFSLLLLLTGTHDATITVPGGEFHFRELRIWKYSEGRQERIPALSARLDNRTGRDWAELTVRVHAVCPGGDRVYDVRLRSVHTGSQTVAETAFGSIGTVSPCEETAVNIEFAGGTPADPPTYVIVGFAHEFGDSGWSTELEGLLDHRRPSDLRSITRHVYWRDGGEKLFEVGGNEPAAFYSFRVEPGEFGLAGFTLTRDPQDSGTLTRFLRVYLLPPGTTSYLGVFRVFRGQGNGVGVRLEFDPKAYDRLKSREAGTLAPRPYQPLVGGNLAPVSQ